MNASNTGESDSRDSGPKVSHGFRGRRGRDTRDSLWQALRPNHCGQSAAFLSGRWKTPGHEAGDLARTRSRRLNGKDSGEVCAGYGTLDQCGDSASRVAGTYSAPAELRGEKGLCCISLLEAAILHRLGRLDIQGTLPEFFAVALSSDLQLLELTPAVAVKTNQLSEGFHGDPFDRTIVATAAVMNLTLITSNSAIRDAKMCAVEYYPFKPSRAKV